MNKENNPAPDNNDSGDKGQEEKKLEDRERTITLRERRADAKDVLSDRNINTDLVYFVVDIDEDKNQYQYR